MVPPINVVLNSCDWGDNGCGLPYYSIARKKGTVMKFLPRLLGVTGQMEIVSIEFTHFSRASTTIDKGRTE